MIKEYRDVKEFGNIKKIDIKLWDRNGKRLWKESNSYPIADVVAIELPSAAGQGCFFTSFSKDDVIINDPNSTLGKEVVLGLQAMVFGYPLNFYDKMNHFPMTRIGYVATHPWFDFDSKPCFLIDARLHQGMSGSPVVSYPGKVKVHDKTNSPHENCSENGNGIFLLGIFSAEYEPLGLNVVWHADIIEDIINNE